MAHSLLGLSAENTNKGAKRYSRFWCGHLFTDIRLETHPLSPFTWLTRKSSDCNYFQLFPTKAGFEAATKAQILKCIEVPNSLSQTSQYLWGSGSKGLSVPRFSPFTRIHLEVYSVAFLYSFGFGCIFSGQDQGRRKCIVGGISLWNNYTKIYCVAVRKVDETSIQPLWQWLIKETSRCCGYTK